jgi:hypothetical protein
MTAFEASMGSPVGADIESICGKCGDVWHVVVAKIGDQVAKVQCKICGGYHRHRPPDGGEVPKRPRATRTATTRSAPTRPPPPRPAQPAISADMTVPVRTYRASDAYHPGERVEHPTFGVGLVEDTTAIGRMTVFFESGRRVLAQAKPTSTLERPPPIVHEEPE